MQYQLSTLFALLPLLSELVSSQPIAAQSTKALKARQAAGIDVGPCTDFSMSFKTGFAAAQSATEVRFGPSDATQFSQGAALNSAIISNAMCDTFVNACAKSATTRDTCKEVKTTIDAELAAGTLAKDQSYADAWLSGLETAFGITSTGRGTEGSGADAGAETGVGAEAGAGDAAAGDAAGDAAGGDAAGDAATGDTAAGDAATGDAATGDAAGDAAAGDAAAGDAAAEDAAVTDPAAVATPTAAAAVTTFTGCVAVVEPAAAAADPAAVDPAAAAATDPAAADPADPAAVDPAAVDPAAADPAAADPAAADPAADAAIDAVTPPAVDPAQGDGEAAIGSEMAVVDPASEGADAGAGAANAGAAEGTNIQTFASTLNGIPATPVLQSDAARPFSVKGDTFLNSGAALQRSCDQQFNGCANAANGGQVEASVAECEAQKTACGQAIAAITV